MSRKRACSLGPLCMPLPAYFTPTTDFEAAADAGRIAERSLSAQARSEQFEESSKEHCSLAAKQTQHHLPSPYSEDFTRNKRKREEQDSRRTSEEERPSEQKRLDDTYERNSAIEQSDSVGYWVYNEFDWSKSLKAMTTMDERRGRRPAKKRSLSRSSSYKQSTLSGDTPRAWGGKHAENMLEKGIFMERQENATIIEDDKHLCRKILEASYDVPREWRFQEDNFLTVVKRALWRNEARVVRDIGPHIMPSPELLSAQGHPGLENIAEAVDAQWIKCTSLCGPRTKPDGSHGVSRFVFDEQEREKLTANNTCACEGLMFPFYIHEAKCCDKSIEESELQALHAASVASNTVIELYQKISAAEEIHRRILAFSVSHNQRLVKIFAHFALINGQQPTFHRHRLFEADLIDDPASRTRPYQIALAIWEHFFPIHLSRIKDVLARQRPRAMESFTAQLGVEDCESGTCTPSSSQEDNVAVLLLQEENARLLNTMLVQQEDSHKQIEQYREQMERQSEQTVQMQQRMNRQSEQYREQMERLSEQTVQMQQRMDRQSEQHKEQMERQSEQHKEQMERQSEQHKEQVEQQREIISLLKQKRP